MKGEHGATLLLLSDGHANVGITDHAQLERAATAAHGQGVTSSTIGLGRGYDEALIAAIARGGQGNTHFPEEGDTAGAAVASEVDHLLEQIVQVASLTVRPTGRWTPCTSSTTCPPATIEGGFAVELGDFYAGEQRKLLLTIDVPAMTACGLAEVCELELRWVDVSTLDTHTATIPVHVNVVPDLPRRRQSPGRRCHRKSASSLCCSSGATSSGPGPRIVGRPSALAGSSSVSRSGSRRRRVR